MSRSNHILKILLNDEIVLEYDRSKPIPLIQLEYLDNVDARMDAGIQLKDELLIPSTALEKSQYVANLMVNSLLKYDPNQAIAMCTYLGNRVPNLKQVICTGENDEVGIRIEFIYNRDSTQKPPEQTIQFFDPKNFQKKEA